MTARREAPGAAAESSRGVRPVIRATIDLASGQIRYDAWAVDDYEGERWVLEARQRRLLQGRAMHFHLEKRGSQLVGCTTYRAARTEIAAVFGVEAAARFFEPGQEETEITLELPIPLHMDLSALPHPVSAAVTPPLPAPLG